MTRISPRFITNKRQQEIKVDKGDLRYSINIMLDLKY